MLGILLTILKIIGIILLVLIGLILLAAAVILLVPIRYHGEGAREEKILSGKDTLWKCKTNVASSYDIGKCFTFRRRDEN